MGILGDSLDRAAASTATRPIPKSAGAQMRFLVKQFEGPRPLPTSWASPSARSNATSRTRSKNHARTLRPDSGEGRNRWQPRVKEKAKKNAATSTGIVVETRARFGFTAAPGTTDDGRIRLITLHLPPQHAARLFDAQTAGASEQQLQAVIAEGLWGLCRSGGGPPRCPSHLAVCRGLCCAAAWSSAVRSHAPSGPAAGRQGRCAPCSLALRCALTVMRLADRFPRVWVWKVERS
ncbi:telomere-protecting terminal protein Tpg [Streptomyces sp. NBC_01637]|uniref:telomere-protecting terminal protein Tpg n=1 Tax=unclassified Streptomyces TaxID=2593676 RepID=UPI0038649741